MIQSHRVIAEEIAKKYNYKIVGRNPEVHTALISALMEAMSAYTTTHKLEEIAQDEHNYQISCFFDAGFTVKLGDEVNGFKATSPLCDDFDECADWLQEQIARGDNGHSQMG